MGQDLNSPPIGHGTAAPTAFPPNSPGLRMFLVVDVVFLMIACLGLVYVVRSSWFADRLKQRQQANGFRAQQRFSCHHCRYFGQNPYLKCALHPTTVLTEQAADCRDYVSLNLPKDI
jgi:hypothetical protein